MTPAPVNIDTAEQQTAALKEERNCHVSIISHLLWCLLCFKIKLLKRSINLHFLCTNNHMIHDGGLVWSSGLFFFLHSQPECNHQRTGPPSWYKVWSPSQVQSLVRHLPLSIRWRIWTSITHVKRRINRHFGVSRICVVCVKAGMNSSVGSLPRTISQGKWWAVTAIMLKRWTHVKVLQTEINTGVLSLQTDN